MHKVWMMLCTKGILLMQLSTEELRKMEEEEAWEPADRVPIIDEDITEVRFFF